MHSPVIGAARRVAGTLKERYPIDIRSYLETENNAVVHGWLGAFVATLPVAEQLRFHRRSIGDFDFRADVVLRAMGTLKYHRARTRSFDQWLFPEETLSLGHGDCEDLAFVLAAALLAAGISADCVRVALGSLSDRSNPAAVHAWDHAWVAYQRESGAWQILEPLAKVAHAGGGSGGRGADIEYRPHFVFNTNHLWRVRSSDARASSDLPAYLEARQDRFWSAFDPSFAAGVHSDIYDHALAGMSRADLVLVKAKSLEVDVNVLCYDPRDHFDFAYIDEGWRRAEQRLATGDLGDFALAVHAIGDFYAHSMYGYFAEVAPTGALPPYDPAHPLPADRLAYDFLRNEARPGATCDAEAFAATWRGRLISGQWWRWYTTYPHDLRGDIPRRRCLPDHDRIAVDSATLDEGTGHALFPDPAQYALQFQMRRQTAIKHIEAVYAGWKK